MSDAAKVLFESIRQLSEADRIAVSDAIWETLSETTKDGLFEEDPSNDPEHRKMLEERAERNERDPSLRVPSEEVHRRLQEMLGKKLTAAAL